MGRQKKIHLDHVHILVANREEAAAWFGRTFQFECIECSDDPYGPLTVSGDGGTTGIALFTSKVTPEPNRVVAFRVDGVEFLNFAQRLSSLNLSSNEGQPLGLTDVVDHGDVLSYYFLDPDGNGYELATYDVDAARRGIKDQIAETLMRP